MASTDIKDYIQEGEVEENDEAAAGSSRWYTARSRRWDTLNSPQQSQWLQTTLSDLDNKTKAMLDIMEDDSDSFAKRAEMYYKKRPELVQMVEDLTKSYRCLAQNYENLRSDSFRFTNPELFPSSNSSFNQVKQLQNSLNQVQQLQTCHQEKIREDFESLKTELMLNNSRKMKLIVNTHDHDDEKVNNEVSNEIESSSGGGSKVDERQTMLFLEREKMWNEMSLRVSKLVEDNLKEQEQLIKRNDKKREDIEQLYSEINRLMDENKALKSCQSSCHTNKVDIDKKQNQTRRASIFKKISCIRFKT
ncbi:protein NETWORKED 3C-like [Pistacia vera]|uniref:protein NETWORKED 3C-like n=1 Tax=Pistacia vera TaxID=55513 RepID=UPI001263A3E1|nr:protein NETWORKED 3C-like [Pistacia vera]